MKTEVKDTKTGKIVSVEDPEKFIKHRKMGNTILKDGIIQEVSEVEEAPVEEEEEIVEEDEEYEDEEDEEDEEVDGASD
mgnify:CR=1 FL=1